MIFQTLKYRYRLKNPVSAGLAIPLILRMWEKQKNLKKKNLKS